MHTLTNEHAVKLYGGHTLCDECFMVADIITRHLCQATINPSKRRSHHWVRKRLTVIPEIDEQLEMETGQNNKCLQLKDVAI